MIFCKFLKKIKIKVQGQGSRPRSKAQAKDHSSRSRQDQDQEAHDQGQETGERPLIVVEIISSVHWSQVHSRSRWRYQGQHWHKSN